MREFRHKITGIKGELLEDGHLHFDRTGGNESCHETIWFGFIENSQDWEEIEQPYYEILDLINKKGSTVNYETGGEHYSTFLLACYKNKAHFLQCFLDSGVWSILSVKRLSDGVIFTVGDTVICNEKYVEKIKSIDFFQEKHLVFNFKKTTDNFTTESEWDRMVLKKDSFLTTQDGVELSEGDICYIPQRVGKNNWGRVLEFKVTEVTNPDDLVYVFSKKENAEKYISEHKKKYSLNNLRSILLHFAKDCAEDEMLYSHYDGDYRDLNKWIEENL